MPSVDVYENFLKRSQAVAGGRRRSQAVGTPIELLSCRGWCDAVVWLSMCGCGVMLAMVLISWCSVVVVLVVQ